MKQIAAQIQVMILERLLAERECTLEELAERLGGMSQRTVRRRLRELADTGVDLVETRRPHGMMCWSIRRATPNP